MGASPTTIDFETQAIGPRPAYPPAPVGVAIKKPGRPSRWYGWGFPTKNNCDRGDAVKALGEVWHKGPLLFHNGKFDLDVAESHLGFTQPSWERVHDTLFQLFLYNPNADTMALKPASQLLLNMPPDEQSEVRQWLIDKGIVRADNARWGDHISDAPGDLVGKYAIGDVERTFKLHELLMPYIVKNDMLRAYDRERELQPILLKNERSGMRVDVRRLERDIAALKQAIGVCDNWLRTRLGRPGLNVDSNKQIVDAFKSAGVVTDFPRTAKGGDSVSKKLLTPDMYKDPQVASAFGYRNRACTCLSVWMKKWLEQATANKGYIFTDWSQTRGTKDSGERKGARTGRLASSPPFMNIPKKWEGKIDGYIHPAHLEIPPLPLVRRYVLPDRGEKILHRDYAQQELRVLAHFEDGPIAAMYLRDPKTDFHSVMQEIINANTGLGITRDDAKIIDLALAYAMGAGKLAASLKTDVATARRIKEAQRRGMPGISMLERDIKERAEAGKPVRTWGGRLYYKEQPIYFNGVKKDLGYKLPNTLIQGSAADMTKEAIIRYHNHPKKTGRFLLTVHDEINVTAKSTKELAIMKEVMESVEFSIPMVTDAKVGPNLGELKPYKD